MGWSDAVGLSGYAAAFADAMANGGSYADAYNAASAATGQSGYDYFNDSGGVSHANVDYGSPYASQYSSLMPASLQSGQTSQQTKNDKVSSALLPSLKPTSKDLLQFGDAYYYDAQGNPTAVNFGASNWQPAWSALWGAGNQIVTDSTNLSNIGKDIRTAGYTNSNPMIWSQQAAHNATLTNPQGQSLPVSPTVQQLAQAALQRVDADKGRTQAAVNAKAYENTKNWYEANMLEMPKEYDNLLPGNYSITPWVGSAPTHTGQVSSIDQNLMNAGLSTEFMAQMTPAERFELYQQFRGGVAGGGY